MAEVFLGAPEVINITTWIGHACRDWKNNTTIAITWALKVKEEDQDQHGEGLLRQRGTNWEGVLGGRVKLLSGLVHQLG